MKKAIICFVCAIFVISALFIMHINAINEQHDADLDTLYRLYGEETTELLNENSELSHRVCELEQQIYNILNDNDYDVTINHDGELHTYTYEGDGIFGRFTHRVSTY